MTITPPVLDPRDEDDLVAEVVDDLPAELSDRNRSSLSVELVEGVGTFYAKLLYYLNQWPRAVEYKILSLLGVTPEPATNAVASLTFTSSADSVTAIVVSSGTIVKTGLDNDAVEFVTDVDVIVPPGGATATVEATSSLSGSGGNVAPNTAIYLDGPVAGIASVTNLTVASGGQDEETFLAMQARSTAETRAQDRIVTNEDAQGVAVSVSGALRAKALGATYYNGSFAQAAGVRAVAIVDTSINQTQDPTLKANVKGAIESKDWPGTTVLVHQPDVRVVYIENVVATLDGTRTETAVAADMLLAMAQYFTAVDVYDDDGVTLIRQGWRWGEPMYAYEVISLLDGVAGIGRIQSVTMNHSDSYDAGWLGAGVPLADLAPGTGGAVTTNWGLIHWGGDYTPPVAFTLTIV
jgi:hypothetical protein